MSNIKDSIGSSIVLIHHRQQNVIAEIVNSGFQKMVNVMPHIQRKDITWLIIGFVILLSLSQVKLVNEEKSGSGKILKKGLIRNE